MTPERWREVKTVLGESLDRPADERARFLEHRCGRDRALRSEVASLLGNVEAADSLPAVRAAVAAEAALVGTPDEASRPGAPDADAALRPLLESALGTQYDLLRPLGSGGMGAVYLAWERALERFVAVKVLRPDLAAAPDGRERFRREARIAAQLAHPGIMPLYTFGEVRGTWYFVMGYVQGESLAEHLRLRGRLPPAEARAILADLTDALACAHRHGVVHRDIKPANVLLDATSGRAVLTDFGIAKIGAADDGLTASGAVLGTPQYMSPEQARGEVDVDERSDVYSLGAVGYAMLTGRAPTAGTGRAAGPTPIRRLAPAVPEAVAAVVMRCLAPDRARRWPDVRSLGAALDRADRIDGDGDDGGPAPPRAGTLRDVSGYGPFALVWALAWSALVPLTPRASADARWLTFVALLVPVGLGLHVWTVERDGLTALELARATFSPPRWWGMWWPGALRRPGDLWPRLPWPARLVRRTLSAVIVALPLTLLGGRWLTAVGVLRPADGGRWPGAAVARGLVLAAAVLSAGALAWALTRGLSVRQAVRVLFGATTPSSIWRAAPVARLLARATHGVRPPEPDQPADHARAIGDLARLLPTSAADAGASARRTADRIVAALAALDLEIAALVRDAGPAEQDRLAARLSALEHEPRDDADDVRRELRALVQHQLALVQRLRGRHEAAVHRRRRLNALLWGLWAQLCRVHDASAGPPGELPEAVTRLQTLCAEVDAGLGERRSDAAILR